MYCMYLYESYVYACMLFVFVFYVYELRAQTSPLTAITWQIDSLLGREHAGPTQGSPGQTPIRFNSPSETPLQTRFGAPTRAARVEGVQLGFRVWSIGPLCAFIHR